MYNNSKFLTVNVYVEYLISRKLDWKTLFLTDMLRNYMMNSITTRWCTNENYIVCYSNRELY